MHFPSSIIGTHTGAIRPHAIEDGRLQLLLLTRLGDPLDTARISSNRRDHQHCSFGFAVGMPA